VVFLIWLAGFLPLSLDGPTGWLFFVMCPLDSRTIYSKGFSDLRFRRIEIGMTGDEVERILGPPLSRSHAAGWEYTQQATGTSNYFKRVIWFKDGRVEKKAAEFWVD
jgi:hypothetical protein